MEITRENFNEMLPALSDDIKSSSFLSLDCEFTGISDNNVSAFDTPEEVYEKTCNSTEGYIIVQFGLTIFRQISTEPLKFNYKSYNFYVYPRTKKNTFKCQGECLSFLSSYGFDFNKLFHHGITFCDAVEAKRMQEKLEDRQRIRILDAGNNKLDISSHVIVPDDEKEMLENASVQIENFLNSSEPEVVIKNCNGFQRKLIYEMIQTKYNDKVSPSTRAVGNNIKVIVVERKKTKEEEREQEDQRRKKEQDDVEESIGFSKLMNIISESGKLIVGHNMMLDLIYILRQFFAPLPADFKEFKKFAHSVFPRILDTKLLCSHEKLKNLVTSSILQHVYQTVQTDPFKLPDIEPTVADCAYALDDPKEHEAGYDSYLTGVCFLGLANYMNVNDFENIRWNNSSLKMCLNRIFLMRINDINYISLVGEEHVPNRDHVFFISFPEHWKQIDIVERFRKFGPIFISWINNTSAYIALHNKENFGSVLNTIEASEGFKITGYMDKAKANIKRRRNSGSTSSDDGTKKATKKKNRHEKKKLAGNKRTGDSSKGFTEGVEW